MNRSLWLISRKDSYTNRNRRFRYQQICTTRLPKVRGVRLRIFRLADRKYREPKHRLPSYYENCTKMATLKNELPVRLAKPIWCMMVYIYLTWGGIVRETSCLSCFAGSIAERDPRGHCYADSGDRKAPGGADNHQNQREKGPSYLVNL